MVCMSLEDLCSLPRVNSSSCESLQGGKRSVLVTEYMDKSDLGTLLGRDELTEKFAWVRNDPPSRHTVHNLSNVHS